MKELYSEHIQELLLTFTVGWVVISIFYLVFCFVDIAVHNPQVRTTLQSVGVITPSGEVQYYDDVNSTVILNPGDDIVARMEVERIRSARNFITRNIVQGEDEVIIFSALREHRAGTKNTVIAIYDIPRYVDEEKCGYVYSINSRNFTWNAITFINPVVNETPKIRFCFNG